MRAYSYCLKLSQLALILLCFQNCADPRLVADQDSTGNSSGDGLTGPGATPGHCASYQKVEKFSLPSGRYSYYRGFYLANDTTAFLLSTKDGNRFIVNGIQNGVELPEFNIVVPSPFTNANPQGFAKDSKGNVYLHGYFLSPANDVNPWQSFILKFNSATGTWSPFITIPATVVYSILFDEQDRLVAAHQSWIGGKYCSEVKAWNGTAWTSMAAPICDVYGTELAMLKGNNIKLLYFNKNSPGATSTVWNVQTVSKPTQKLTITIPATSAFAHLVGNRNDQLTAVFSYNPTGSTVKSIYHKFAPDLSSSTIMSDDGSNNAELFFAGSGQKQMFRMPTNQRVGYRALQSFNASNSQWEDIIQFDQSETASMGKFDSQGNFWTGIYKDTLKITQYLCVE